MAVRGFDHVNLCATDVAATVAFYHDILEMIPAPNPGAPAGSEAAWLLDTEGHAVIHVSGTALLTMTGGDPSTTGSGRIHHVALDCLDHAGTIERLARAGLAWTSNELPQLSRRQLFVRDPDDILIELNFPA